MSNYIQYLCVGSKDEGESNFKTTAFLNSIEDTREWRQRQLSGKRQNVGDETLSAGASEKSTNEENAYELLADSFFEALNGYRPLVNSAQSLMPALRYAYLESRVWADADKMLQVVEEEAGFKTYGICKDTYSTFKSHVDVLREFDQSIDVLPSAILLSLIATFDSFISEIIELQLRKYPDRFRSSDKTIALKDLLSMSSFEEAIDHVIGDEVDRVMASSHSDQVEYIEKKFNVSVRKGYENWSQFAEIFERRNLAAHGNLKVNTRYLRNCIANGHKVEGIKQGDILRLNNKYLNRSIDCLTEFGLLLIFVIWKKNHEDRLEAIYSKYNDLAYNLIRRKRFTAASRLLNFFLFQQTEKKIGERTRRMMTINLANCLKNLKKWKEGKEILENVDWSATGNTFRICIAALNEDFDLVAKLLPAVAASEEISKSEFRDWPVFEWVRGNEQIGHKFLEVFGEPILIAVEEKLQKMEQEDPPK